METKKDRSVEVCLTPGLFEFRQNRGEVIVVVVDVFRAGSTICAALAAGFEKIKPIAEESEARKLKLKGWQVAGEREGVKLDFADFGNSPVILSKTLPSDLPFVLTTSNGTKAIHVAKNAGKVVIGTFNNLHSVSNWLLKQDEDIIILCSGWKGSLSMEDTLFAGALAIQLLNSGQFKMMNDEVSAAIQLWVVAGQNFEEAMKSASHYQRLMKLGAAEDIKYAMTINNTNVIPIFDGDFITNLTI